MVDFLYQLAAVALAVFGGLLFLYSWTAWTSRVRFRPDQRIPVVTSDGHRLWLYRRRARGNQGTPRGAVLCIHGLGASHFNFDYPGSGDLAGWLAEYGYEVFTCSLRGDFDSSAPSGAGHGYSFDAYVQHDMPALVAAVKLAAGVQRVHLLGHSMGGLVAYAHACTNGQLDVSSVATMGSPVGFEERGAVIDHDRVLEWLAHSLPFLPIRWGARLVVPFLPLIANLRSIRRQFTRHNVDLGYVSRAMWHALSNVPAGVLHQFGDWIREDAFRSADTTVDYREALRALEVPLMVIAGAADHLARPSNVLRAAERAASSFKVVHLLGEESGCVFDYGHIDMLFGTRAAEEVFVRVGRFLDQVVEAELGITSRDVGLA